MIGKVFTQSQVRSIADALADTSEGMTGSEIGHMILTCRMRDVSPDMTKRHRLYNAFVDSQHTKQNRTAILEFIRQTMRPELYTRNPGHFERMRSNLNQALAFAGLEVAASGKLQACEKVQTLSQAQRRAHDLREDLELRKVHPDVIKYCREELLVDNYFHAIFEATKSVAEKMREKTGLTDDGGTLVDRVLGGEIPMLAINPLATESEKSEQRGFANLIKGVFGYFRNPHAHAPKIGWAVDMDDAEEALTLLSMIHKRLDGAHMPRRV